ncbi:MAG: ABC-F family ATP-binding cassette domain-containing protein [Clostridia bacterium]|nr:ABC-F family ATP-binding cassette domain-containing protein [Clostridia bacterium]
MISISVQDISLSFGTDVILKDVSFALEDGDRLGIIGVNGAGKTSLFRIISGEYSADAGQVFIQRGHRVGLLEQNPKLDALPEGLTCLEYMYTAFPELLCLEEKISALECEIAGAEGKETLTLAERLAELNRLFAEGGGLEFRSRCRGMLLRLGFSDEIINRKISTLSGGQYTRLALARLLATEPDILMLDEPTNHLDIDALEWLEGFLATYKKTVIIISHDRYFLDRTTSKTLRIQNSRARLFHGSYTACLEQQEAEAASLEKRYKEQQKVIAKIRANIEFQRRCNREHNFVTIRSKEKQLARMELVERAERAPRDIRMSFSAEEATANDVISVKELSFSYGSLPLILGLSFLVRRGERVMVLGPNGCGKSTLMKLINLSLTPTRGKITHGYNVKVGYYDQEMRGLSEDKTVFSELHDEYPEKRELEIRSTLALFLFGEDDIEKPVSTLSGGERARLTLAKLILKKVNLLIMDEPTNHLDIGSAEALENALLAFPGTIIAVSHDRYFINRIATRIIELDPTREGGRLDYELGESDEAFTEYMRLRAERRAAAKESARPRSADGRAEYEEKKRENAKRRSEERALERARTRTAELEGELERLNEELFGEAATDYMRAAEIERRKGEIEEELLSLYELIL